MSIVAHSLAYIGKSKANYKPIKAAHHFKTVEKKVPFLWGDMVYVISTNASTTTISAKGHHIKVPTRDLTDDPILCMWQIDCGQGDCALIRLPNGKTMLIDAGPGPLMSNSPVQAPRFLGWMRYVDQSWRDEFEFGGKTFDIDSLVITHPDYDHFGGLLDMVSNLKPGGFKIHNIYHNGLGRYNTKASAFDAGKGLSQLGAVRGTGAPELYVTTLINGYADVRKMLKKSSSRSWVLNGEYKKLLKALEKLQGAGAGNLHRVHSAMDCLPQWRGDDSVNVRILGPVEETWKGKPALRYIDGESKSAMKSPSLTRNGLSVVLRLDYGKARILLTGDLNFRSQAVLLKHIPSVEFKCHVAKACHHGAEDVSSTFLRAMAPLATLFSSGDGETHAHPRAKVLGMAGAFSEPVARGSTQYLGMQEATYTAPLIYSTELSRSTQLYRPGKATKDGVRVTGLELQSKQAGGRKGPTKKLNDWLLADDLIFGLINVRTDGQKIQIGVLKEGKNAGFQIESLNL